MACQMLPLWASIYMPSALQLGGPHLSLTFAILAKGRCFSDLRLKTFVHVAVWIRCYKNKLILRGATVGGLHLPKILKTWLTCFPSIIYYHRNLRLWDEGVHDMNGAIWEKDESIPKLQMKKLRLSARAVMENGTDLKENILPSPRLITP
jgi:hypothetical protein